jgi:hypothetical protein
MPQLINGMLLPDRKNIYIFGTGQARYGAGPLITAGADVLCTIIKTQKRLRHPLGWILQKIGVRPPESNLVGPREVLRGAKQAQRLIPRLVYVEKLLFR